MKSNIPALPRPNEPIPARKKEQDIKTRQPTPHALKVSMNPGKVHTVHHICPPSQGRNHDNPLSHLGQDAKYTPPPLSPQKAILQHTPPTQYPGNPCTHLNTATFPQSKTYTPPRIHYSSTPPYQSAQAQSKPTQKHATSPHNQSRTYKHT